MSKAEAMLIARDAAAEALDQHAKQLPIILKPVMYEVAENVNAMATKNFNMLLSKLLTADVMNDEHIRDFHKDLYYLRDKRVQHESDTATARQEVVKMVAKYGIGVIIIGILAWCGLYEPRKPGG